MFVFSGQLTQSGLEGGKWSGILVDVSLLRTAVMVIKDEWDDMGHSKLGLSFQECSNGLPMAFGSKILFSTFTGMKKHLEKFSKAVEAVGGKDIVNFPPARALWGSQGDLSRCR